TGNSTSTFDLKNAGKGGDVNFEPATLKDVKPGEQRTVTITGKEVSSHYQDVVVQVMHKKEVLAKDKMTVVSVSLGKQGNIYNSKTPPIMVQQHQYRIPPRVDTDVAVKVQPDDLPASVALTLVVTPTDKPDLGTVKVNGQGTFNFHGDTTVQ